MRAYPLRVKGSSPSQRTLLQVERRSLAARASLQPTEADSGGYFYVGATGSLDVGFNGQGLPVFGIVWRERRLVFELQRLAVLAYLTGAAPAGGMFDFVLRRYTRGLTAPAPLSGGAIVTPAAKALNRYSQSLVHSCVITTGAPLTTVGGPLADATVYRRVADGQIAANAPSATVGITPRELVLFNLTDAGAHPFVLQSGEWLLIEYNYPNNGPTPARIYVTAEWIEAPVP